MDPTTPATASTATSTSMNDISSSSRRRRKKSYPTTSVWGEVRASPVGCSLTSLSLSSSPSFSSSSSSVIPTATATSTNDDTSKISDDHNISNHPKEKEVWDEWRQENLPAIQYPAEGYHTTQHNYHHMNGENIIHMIDTTPLGSSGGIGKHRQKDRMEENDIHPDTDDEKKYSTEDSNSNDPTATTSRLYSDYGSEKTPLDAPIGSLREKWRLLPYFIQLRSILKQHIDSFNHFIEVDMKQIIIGSSGTSTSSNTNTSGNSTVPTGTGSSNEIRSDHDPKFYMIYENCWIGEPSIDEESYSMKRSTPYICRIRDCTYSAPLYVNIRYTRGHQIVVKRNVIIGRIPIMLRSKYCILHNKCDAEQVSYKECCYDPGGYFVIKGIEKVILIQEQLSKNRVILEADEKGGGTICASITSSTNERKSKSYILFKHGRIYLKNNTLGDDIPILIVFKAMGIVSDMEILQLIAGGSNNSSSGTHKDSNDYNNNQNDNNEEDAMIVNAMALSFEEVNRLRIHTQLQALQYIGNKIRGRSNSANMGPTTTTTPTPTSAPGTNTSGPAIAAITTSSGSNKPILLPEDEAREVLAYVVLSHVPVENFHFRTKCIYIGHVIRRVLLVSLGKMPLDDKDYYGNKRLELAGNLLSLLFEDLFKIFNKDLKRQADLVLSKPNRAQAFDIVKCIRPDTITNGMINAIATGNWVLKRFRMDRAGVTQVLSRLSYMSALGMMTRINSQFEKTRKVSGPRSLQASQWGMLCPADTPEGEACGLVKNLALLAHITTDEENTNAIERLCRDLGVEDVRRMTGHEIHSRRAYIVFVNGLVMGVHTKPITFVKNLREMRRRGLAGEFVSVSYNENQRAVHIATDGGRVCRPLIIVDEDTGLPKLLQIHLEALALHVLTIRDLLQQGIVEYVDCNEENNTLIALTERDLEIAILQGLENRTMRYTHLEIDPLTILGVIGGIIPFPHHNQAPRNTYTVAMAKQAMGCVAINMYERMDGLLYSLVYPQKPMVKSRTLDLVNFDNIPGGQNACIAVMSYSGYDIEDAIILNKASVDRGYGRCMVLRKHQTSVRRYANGSMDRTCAPPDPNNFPDGENDKRYIKYQAIDEDGICRVGELLDNGSVMVNKESPTDTTSNLGGINFGFNAGGNDSNVVQYRPSGMSYRSNAPSYVDKVLITSNEHEQFLIKVMLRQVRRPEIGDKFASRHGQKGVCGLIVPEEDLPFNEMGHVPDLIMNPHGFPSRMTIGKLLELVVGKGGLYEGRQGYSTAFGEEHGSADTAESAAETLLRNGLNYTGKDIYYSGTNGEPIDAYIFSGPVFYQKLKHMVLDKMHSRARGPRAVLTRQPTEGRSRDGGLRLGEMERDCLIAYGASNLIMERLMHSSDAFSANVCLTCGLLQYQNWCQYCRSGEHVADIRLPYACKLLFQELQSMNVIPRLRLTDT